MACLLVVVRSSSPCAGAMPYCWSERPWDCLRRCETAAMKKFWPLRRSSAGTRKGALLVCSSHPAAASPSPAALCYLLVSYRPLGPTRAALGMHPRRSAGHENLFEKTTRLRKAAPAAARAVLQKSEYAVDRQAAPARPPARRRHQKHGVDLVDRRACRRRREDNGNSGPLRDDVRAQQPFD